MLQLFGDGLLGGFGAALVYLAFEPYFRRVYPKMLIGWTRLLSGRWRDPMIGRDILIGAAAGSFCGIVGKLPNWFVPYRTSFTALTSLRHVVYLVLYSVELAAGTSLLTAFLFLMFRVAGRSTAVATLLLIVAEMGLMAELGFSPGRLGAALVMAVVLTAMLRIYGLLALASLMLCN